jgi:hypothetical protein
LRSCDEASSVLVRSTSSRGSFASDNGGVKPLALSSTASTVAFSIGRSLKNAAIGDLFAVLLQPEQIV